MVKHKSAEVEKFAFKGPIPKFIKDWPTSSRTIGLA
jgi:hypothetical protein